MARGNKTPQSGTFIATDGTCAPWTYKPNRQTRNIGVRIDGRGNIRVIMPIYSLLSPEQVVQQHREFIEETLAKQGPTRRYKAEIGLEEVLTLQKLPLLGLAEVWHIERKATNANSIRLAINNQTRTMILTGATDDEALTGAALRKAVIKRASALLPPLLQDIAQWAHLSYSECKVRSATTRWGSCNSKGGIMLSATLAFLPTEAVFHVMCHELCHTVYPNHGAEFHGLLEQLDPQAKAHAKMLKTLSGMVPTWM